MSGSPIQTVNSLEYFFFFSMNLFFSFSLRWRGWSAVADTRVVSKRWPGPSRGLFTGPADLHDSTSFYKLLGTGKNTATTFLIPSIPYVFKLLFSILSLSPLSVIFLFLISKTQSASERVRGALPCLFEGRLEETGLFELPGQEWSWLGNGKEGCINECKLLIRLFEPL